MTEESMAVHFRVRVDHHLFLLVDNGQRIRIPRSRRHKLIPSVPGYAAVKAGIAQGDVRLTVEVLDQEPASLEIAEWEEVVEISFEATVGRVRIETVDDAIGAPPFPLLTPHGPGDYRIRVHARGRDIAYDKVVENPVEDYLLQIWPAPPAPERTFKWPD